jgi:RES domain-containing protein
MAQAWRIVRAIHAATAFSGEGAAKFGGRWNSPGVAIVYSSATQALAALETLVHLNPFERFSYKAFEIQFDERLAERHTAALPGDWRAEPPSPSTQRIGDQWVKRSSSPVLSVPSAIIPKEFNFLLNPAHPDVSGISVGKPFDFTFDPRLT